MKTTKFKYNAGQWQKIESVKISMKDINRAEELGEYPQLIKDLEFIVNTAIRNNYDGELTRFSESVAPYIMRLGDFRDLTKSCRLSDKFTNYYNFNKALYKICVRRYEIFFWNFIKIDVYKHVR